MAYVATVAKNKAGRAAAITGLACVAIFANSGSALAQAPTERIVTAPPAAQILRAQPRGNLLAARPMVGPPAATTTDEARIDLDTSGEDRHPLKAGLAPRQDRKRCQMECRDRDQRGGTVPEPGAEQSRPRGRGRRGYRHWMG